MKAVGPYSQLTYTRLPKVGRIIYAGFPSFSGLGLEDGHVPTFRLLLYICVMCMYVYNIYAALFTIGPQEYWGASVSNMRI